MDKALVKLNQKVDRLSEQVAFLAEEARAQQSRRREWDELKNDLTPVANEVYQLSVRQLDEVESYVQLEDIARLLKRLMRNTRNVEQMLDQLEGIAELAQEVSPLTQDMFLILMTRLDEMERKGFFAFMRGGLNIFDRIIENFSEEDVRLLGENIVTILETIKEMTQPEIMLMMRNTALVIREEEVNGNVSMLSILRQMNDPASRRGLSTTLALLRAVSEN